MSLHAYAWAWAAKAPSAGAKLVLVALADYADETTGECFPSLKIVAQRTGLTRRGVQLGIGKLVDAKLVTVKARQRSNGSDTSNTYVLALKPVEYPPEVDETGGEQNAPPQGEQSAPPGRTEDAPPGEHSAPPYPSVNPSDDPAPQPPKGGRARDRDAWLEELNAWAGEHFPGLDPSYVRAAITFLPSDVPRTAENLRNSRLGWTLVPTDDTPTGTPLDDRGVQELDQRRERDRGDKDG